MHKLNAELRNKFAVSKVSNIIPSKLEVETGSVVPEDEDEDESPPPIENHKSESVKDSSITDLKARNGPSIIMQALDKSKKSSGSGLVVKARGVSCETFGMMRLEDKQNALDFAQAAIQSSGEKSSLKRQIFSSLAPKSVASRGGTDDESYRRRRFSMDNLLLDPKEVLKRDT